MEDKVPVVIQGKTIQRERQTRRREQPELLPYDYSHLTRAESDSAPFSLSTLRETRNAAGRAAPRVKSHMRTNRSFRQRPYNRDTFSTRSTSTVRSTVRSRSQRRNVDETQKNNSLVIKVAVATLLALVVLLLNQIQLPFTQAMVGHVRTALTRDFDWDETLGKLKFVGNILPDEIKSVFRQDTDSSRSSSKDKDSSNEVPAFASPVRGEVVHSFGEQVILQDTGKVYTNQGIDVRTGVQASFFASADGIVAAVEEHETYGLSLWLDHGNRIFSFYGRCATIEVKKGDKVKTGQKLGIVGLPSDSKPLLHFQIWLNGKPENPLERISPSDQEGKGQGV